MLLITGLTDYAIRASLNDHKLISHGKMQTPCGNGSFRESSFRLAFSGTLKFVENTRTSASTRAKEGSERSRIRYGSPRESQYKLFDGGVGEVA